MNTNNNKNKIWRASDEKLNDFKLSFKMSGFNLNDIKVVFRANMLEICGTQEVEHVTDKPFKYKKEYSKKIKLPNNSNVDKNSVKLYFDADCVTLIVEFSANINKTFFDNFIDDSSDNGRCMSTINNVMNDSIRSKNIFEIKDAIQEEFNKSN
jgi:hypothetical protein